MSDQSVHIGESMSEAADAPDTQTATGVSAQLGIPPDEFVLRETLNAVPDAEFACERVAEGGPRSVLPLVWARGAEHAELDAALAGDPSVERASLLAEAEDRWLYQIEWAGNADILIRTVTNSAGTLLDLSGTDRGWSLHLLYPSRSDFSDAMAFYETHDVPFEIESIRELDADRSREGGIASERSGVAMDHGLTSKQTEALLLAYERGYFEVPRKTTVEELAEELDVSHQAVSELLRRGCRELLGNTLFVEPAFGIPE
jgi:predicted DNA binding protein